MLKCQLLQTKTQFGTLTADDSPHFVLPQPNPLAISPVPIQRAKNTLSSRNIMFPSTKSKKRVRELSSDIFLTNVCLVVLLCLLGMGLIKLGLFLESPRQDPVAAKYWPHLWRGFFIIAAVDLVTAVALLVSKRNLLIAAGAMQMATVVTYIIILAWALSMASEIEDFAKYGDGYWRRFPLWFLTVRKTVMVFAGVPTVIRLAITGWVVKKITDLKRITPKAASRPEPMKNPKKEGVTELTNP